MEKTFSLKLTDEQKSQIAKELGIPIEQVGLHIAYGEAFDEDAKGNDQVIAAVPEKASDGKVWVIEALGFVPLKADGSALFQDVSHVAGGLQQAPGAIYPPDQAKTVKLNPGEISGIRFQPAGTTPKKVV